MTKGEIYAHKVNSDDLPLFIKKSFLNSDNNYLHSAWGGDKDRFNYRIYFSISLSLAILTTLFNSWIMFLVLLNSLTILVIKSARKFNKQKKRFEENRKMMKESFEDWGLPWRD